MLFQSIWGNTVFQILLCQWCVQHWTLSDLLEQIRDEYSEYPVSVNIKDIAQQVWHCCSTYGFLLGRQRMKTFEHGAVQMVYYCHWMCQSMRFGWGNSNTYRCALVKETGKVMFRCPLWWHQNQMVSSAEKEGRERWKIILSGRNEWSLLFYQLGLSVGDRFGGAVP